MPRTALAPTNQPVESSSAGSSLVEGDVMVVDSRVLRHGLGSERARKRLQRLGLPKGEGAGVVELHVAVGGALAHPPSPSAQVEPCERSRHALWPAAPAPAAPVLYHVRRAAAPPARVDLAACAPPAGVLERGDGAYVLDVLEPGGGGANGGGANGGGTRRQYVWGGAELAKRPAAAERMAAVLLARSLHSCDHRGASELVQLDEAPRVEALRGPAAAAAGKPRAFSGEVRSLPGPTPAPNPNLTPYQYHNPDSPSWRDRYRTARWPRSLWSVVGRLHVVT